MLFVHTCRYLYINDTIIYITEINFLLSFNRQTHTKESTRNSFFVFFLFIARRFSLQQRVLQLIITAPLLSVLLQRPLAKCFCIAILHLINHVRYVHKCIHIYDYIYAYIPLGPSVEYSLHLTKILILK